MNIKLIAMDMDGTLLSSKKTVLESTMKAVKYALEKGCIIALATGRLRQGSKPYLKGISKDYKNTYGILANGSLIQSFENEAVLYEETMSMNTYSYLFDCAKESGVFMNAYTKDQILTPHEVIDAVTLREADMLNMPVNHYSVNGGRIESFIKAQFLGEKEKISAAYQASMLRHNDGLNYMHTADYAIEISKTGVSKGQGLLKLASTLGIPQSSTMAIGDHNNDIELIKMAGIGVCMDNGNDQAKEVADYITDTNDRDGIAKAIYKFV